MSQILFHYYFEGQTGCILIIFSTNRTSIFISLLHKLNLKPNIFSQYKEGEAFVTRIGEEWNFQAVWQGIHGFVALSYLPWGSKSESLGHVI